MHDAERQRASDGSLEKDLKPTGTGLIAQVVDIQIHRRVLIED